MIARRDGVVAYCHHGDHNVHAQSDFEFTVLILVYFYVLGKVPQLRIKNRVQVAALQRFLHSSVIIASVGSFTIIPARSSKVPPSSITELLWAPVNTWIGSTD